MAGDAPDLSYTLPHEAYEPLPEGQEYPPVVPPGTVMPEFTLKAIVVGVLVGEAGGSQLRRHSQSAKDLHRTAGDVVALDRRWLAERSPLQHRHVGARVREPHREGEPDRPSPDDHDIRVDHAARVASRP